MCKKNTKSTMLMLFMTSMLSASSLFAQQHVIADKDNTRPEVTRNYSLPARITSVSAFRSNGYNDIVWTSQAEQDTRKFVIEYTTDGVNYSSAGEVLVSAQGAYQLRHHNFESQPTLYRVRAVELNGKSTITQSVLLDGVEVAPVRLYTTVVNGNTINATADFPVERVSIFSEAGQQVYAQDVNGRSGQLTMVIPTLSRGIYFINFMGQNWKSTSKFIVN